jgi:hypothetical protein
MGAPQLSLKEVEAYAQEYDSEVLPKAGCTHDGLHSYGFGTGSVYLDFVKQ